MTDANLTLSESLNRTNTYFIVCIGMRLRDTFNKRYKLLAL